jgi:hypothetical protein
MGLSKTMVPGCSGWTGIGGANRIPVTAPGWRNPQVQSGANVAGVDLSSQSRQDVAGRRIGIRIDRPPNETWRRRPGSV